MDIVGHSCLHLIRQMDEHNHTIANMKKPVIASVKGYALANGAGLAFACDLAIASENAKFGTTAINVGLICLGPAVRPWHVLWVAKNPGNGVDRRHHFSD